MSQANQPAGGGRPEAYRVPTTRHPLRPDLPLHPQPAPDAGGPRNAALGHAGTCGGAIGCLVGGLLLLRDRPTPAAPAEPD